MRMMPTIWIIHREPHHRNALAGLVAAGEGAVVAGPLDPRLSGAATPDGIVLGLSGDFEQELEFAHRHAEVFPNSSWIILTPPGQGDQARQLFDTLEAHYLSYPASALDLRRLLRDGLRHQANVPLSARRSRALLRERFGRWFADLPSHQWMRALDPHLGSVPILIRGRVGSGRGLVARYIHTFGGREAGAFLRVACRDVPSVDALVTRIEASGQALAGRPSTIWLEDVDCLPIAVQHQLLDWLEFDAPPGRLAAGPVHWVAGASDASELDIQPGLASRLEEALSVLDLRIPPLAERVQAVEAFVTATASHWLAARGQAPRRFSPDAIAQLQTRPWPGNLHELESTVLRTLALTSADPILPDQLCFPSQADWLSPSTATPISEFPSQEHRAASPSPASQTARAPSREDEALNALMPQAPGSPSESEISRDILSFFEAEEPGPEDPEQSFDPLQRATDATVENLFPPPSEISAESQESNLRRVIQAAAHAVRNPLVSIRTFAELLPERYDDPEFRDHFRELVGQDVARIDAAVTRLQNTVDLPRIDPHPVDLAHLLDKLIDEHADEIRDRRLLVLKELDHGLPHAYGDPLLLRDAFAGLLESALAAVKDQGDIYIASKHHEAGRAGEPSVRVLLRYSMASGRSQPASNQDLSRDENLAAIMAQTIVQSLGGTFTTDTTDANESVIVIDLPAPGPE
ncbi:MAG: sigma 54-interacting transcriptional regulator [Myxococcota bacterium]|nr:sigma 54-interacting transcriptional regulator [Myxococcota bacterium]